MEWNCYACKLRFWKPILKLSAAGWCCIPLATPVDREAGLVAIKPSGVPYEQVTPADMVVCDLTGKAIDGRLKPSSDIDTHLELYRAFPTIGGVVHTHSEFATAWTQAGRSIPAFGTTHAGYFYGPVPVTEELNAEGIQGDYVLNTGKTIVHRFRDLDPSAMPNAQYAPCHFLCRYNRLPSTAKGLHLDQTKAGGSWRLGHNNAQSLRDNSRKRDAVLAIRDRPLGIALLLWNILPA